MALLRDVSEAEVRAGLQELQGLPWELAGRELGAVAVPVQAGEIWAIKRADGLRHHPRELGFPGGRPDPGDADLAATALRELEEELGVPPATARVLGTLTTTPTATSRFALHPFWVAVDPAVEPQPSPAEVAALIRTPLEHFFAGRIPYRELDLGAYTSPIFDFPEGAMYGASAHVLREVLELYGRLAGARLPQPGRATEIPWQ